MKTRVLLPGATLPAAALLLLAASCNLINPATPTGSLPQPVSITGGEEWADLFPSGISWQSSGKTDGRAGLLLRDGDIFGGKVMTVYRAQDGPALNMTSDDWSARLAGKVVALSLEQGTGGQEWLAKASDHDLAEIRCLTLPDKFDASSLPTLKRLAAANPGTALFVSSNAAVQQVLPLFHPQVLGINFNSHGVDARTILAAQPQITTVVISGEETGSLDLLRQLPGLRRLMIMNWNVEKAGPLPPGLNALRSISVTAKNMKDLSALDAAPAGLEELSIQADELADIRALSRWPGLQALLLRAGEKPVGIPVLADLKQLQWVGLPQDTTQEQFAAFVEAHRNLKILELLGCKMVTDLAPLRELKALEGLVILERPDQQPLDPLRELKTLRFVGIDQNLFNDSPEQVAAIRKALPEALVVPVSGFCLGSGWILLLIPAMAGVRLMHRRRQTAVATRRA